VTKLPDWIYAQSAILPYRLQGDDVEILIITSRKGMRWVLPKGIIEPGMSAAASAAKEAMEEAGVSGRVIGRSLGRYSHQKWGGTCSVEVFPMEVTRELEQWPESAFRRREWVTREEAIKRLRPVDLKKILERLPEAVKDASKDTPADAAITKPPRVLYLYRHAKSSWTDPLLADFDRPLAPRGLRACKTMGSYMRLADVCPDIILCSSSARTRETLKMSVPALAGDIPVKYERALYHAGASALLTRLQRVPDRYNSVLIIGHNPGLQSLAIGLTAANESDDIDRLEAKFPTAGLATLILKRDHWRDLAPESCELHSFVVPRDLDS
jgi:phosphohistidine phosphatase